MKAKQPEKGQSTTSKYHLIKTPVANLFKSTASDKYFMRAKILGLVIKRSLKTKSFEIARIKLKKLHADETERIAKFKKQLPIGTTFKVFAEEHVRRVEASPDLRPATKRYHKQAVDCIYAVWPELEAVDVAAVSASDCLQWSHRLREKYSAPRYNGTVGVCGAIFDIAIEKGVIATNPARTRKRKGEPGIAKAKVKQRKLTLPSAVQFQQLLDKLDTTARCQRAAVTVRFFAFGGPRLSSSAAVLPSDIDWERKEIVLRQTKNGEICRMPMIPEMVNLCVKLIQDHPGGDKPLLPIKNPRAALRSACIAIGITPLTNHDLRHLFITKCIESGVDVKTIATWIGHSDGGALILKTYAHLRNEHSQAMAAKVSFAQPLPAGVIKLEQSR